MNRTKLLLAGIMATGLACVAVVYADDALNGAIKKLAADVKAGKGDAKGVKGELEEVMHAMKPSTKGGIKAGTIDGIEKKIQNLSREGAGKADLAAKGDLEEVGYLVSAIGLVTETIPTDKAKKEKLWKTYSDQMVDGGKKLSAAAKAGVAADIKTAAVAINNSCNACHSKYR